MRNEALDGAPSKHRYAVGRVWVVALLTLPLAMTGFVSVVSPAAATTAPTTSVLVPANGSTLSGTASLDASATSATSVEFWLLGGSYGYSGKLLCTATPTVYGWLCSWNSTTVANGSYALVSEAFNSGGSTYSAPITVTVKSSHTSAAITPVGSLAAVSAPAGANSPTLSVHPQNVGDLMLLGIEDSNTTLPTVSSVSGGGVSSWTLLASDADAAYTQDGDEIWEGVVTAPGPSSIAVTLDGYSDGDDLLAQEFTAGSSVTWSLDKSGRVTGTDAQTFNYPSLTPAGSSELYFGMGNAVNNTQLVGEGTAGVTYINTGLECVSLVAYDTSTTNALAPAVTNSSGGGNGETALAVLVQS